MSEDPLLEIALSVTDGAPVDWTAQDSRIAGEDRAPLQWLQQIHTLAQFQLNSEEATPADGSIRDGVDLPASAPLRWGPLEIIEKVGSGSYGDVYVARDPRLNRNVALKLLRRGGAGAQDQSNVVHEGHLLARVRHQNVVTVYGAERIDGRSGLWMEFVRGETLESELQRRGPLPPEEIALIGIDLCSALEAVHAAGLVHRDVKTQNIMRDLTGRLVLMDFGAGHDAQDAAAYERLAGTPAYLAPEMLGGAPPSEATDIYAAGVALFRLATGGFPVEGSTVRQLREAHDRGELARVTSLRPDFPRRIASVLDQATSPSPSRRFAHVADMRNALDQALHLPQPRVRWRGVVATTVIAVLIAAGGWLARSAGIFVSNRIPENVTGLQLQTIWADAGAAGVHFGTASWDGRSVSAFGSDPRALLVRDLLSHTTRTVVSSTPTSGPEFSAMSRNGAHVAYTWQTDRRYDLRIISTTEANATPRVVVPNDPGRFNYIVPCDWSPDGTKILALLRVESRVELALVDVADGSLTVLKQGYWGLPVRAVFSIDGSYVAASMPADKSGSQHDLFLMHVRGGSVETASITGPSHDVVAGWSPDGTRLLFLSDRSGTTGLWATNVEDGKLAGTAELLRPDFNGTPLGVVQSGALLMAVPISNRDIYVASVDFDTGRTISAPSRPVARRVGNIRSPSFSPDGRLLAYVSERTGADGGLYLVLQSLDDDNVQHLRLPGRTLLQLSWSPDGKSIVGVGPTSENRPGIYRIDVTTGEANLIAKDGTLPQLSPDGAKLYYLRAAGPSFEFVVRTLPAGPERILLRNDSAMFAALSPDGRYVAAVLASPRETPASQRRVVLVPIETGDVRELFRSDQMTLLMRWTADGRRVLISKGGRLGGLRIDGGDPQWLDLQIVPPPQREEHLAVHPDGKRIVYMAGGSKMELWSLENYLPGK